MTYRIERNKWILYRHTNNLDIISAVGVNLKKYSKCSISKKDKKKLLKKLKELDYYKERNPDLPLDAINHKINTLAYYPTLTVKKSNSSSMSTIFAGKPI